jgi:flagellar biosynthesis protein FlhF
VELDGAILTKLDETTGLGEALSVVVQNRLPVAYISDGQRVPEDLHPARSNNLVNRSLSLMQDFADHPTQEDLARAFGSMAG